MGDGVGLEPIVGDGFELVVVPGEVLEGIDACGGRGEVAWPGIGPIAAELVATLPAGLRRRQLDAEPALAPWLVRGIVVVDGSSPTGRRVAGHLGGHDRPGARGMVEVGYTVAAADRGRGLATAAARAWFAWAHAHGARTARLSTTDDNAASLAVIGHLGLEPVGRVWDEDDQAWEAVFEAPLPLPPAASPAPDPGTDVALETER